VFVAIGNLSPPAFSPPLEQQKGETFFLRRHWIDSFVALGFAPSKFQDAVAAISLPVGPGHRDGERRESLVRLCSSGPPHPVVWLLPLHDHEMRSMTRPNQKMDKPWWREKLGAWQSSPKAARLLATLCCCCVALSQ
jgi:hypothetical protein